MKPIKIIKQDYLGRNVWEYSGKLLERRENQIMIEAFFDRGETLVDMLYLREGDKFIETYFLDKWFNIFEIQDQQDGPIKAWYCNISFPAEFFDNTLIYRDLELDLLVYPDGKHKVLDMDDFISLPINSQVRTAAIQALNELQEIFSSGSDIFSPTR
jgi:predicted RNA-binding protein associated with RNAse of E/G family